MHGVIVNSRGERFANLHAWAKEVMPKLFQQDEATLWFVFDESIREKFVVSGSEWAEFDKVDRLILQNESLVKKAATLDELATRTGLPAGSLTKTVQRYNQLVESGRDDDFDRFGPTKTEYNNTASPKLQTPPFFAMQAYPLTRKSMGGVAIDLQCRVIDGRGRPIPHLYAVGELTGLAGVNGKAALEGTFLGPCVLTGRVAARAIADNRTNRNQVAASPSDECLDCHQIVDEIARRRPGHWHFEESHAIAVERKTDCLNCHRELAPYREDHHRIDPTSLTKSCVYCHQTLPE
jgi:succinate dehydrogenase/fumarate reductase flavoprotein subunit